MKNQARIRTDRVRRRGEQAEPHRPDLLFVVLLLL
jgi:hypothetical protein